MGQTMWRGPIATPGELSAGPALALWLEQVQTQGVKLGLAQITKALELVGNPQRSFPSALVGGTNGKGSTVAFASSILSASGLTVGSTFSPHLITYRERFRVNNELITWPELDELTAQLRPRIAACADLDQFTFFELGVLLAMSHFRRQRVDAAVVEVGMGGEFDAGRACQPHAAAVVSVDLDHQQFLGDSIDEIARTKARIAEPGSVLVVAERREDRITVLAREADLLGCELFLADRDFRWTEDQGRFSYTSAQLQLGQVFLPLEGPHQGQNAACAVALVERFCALSELPLPSVAEFTRGIQNTKFAGRLERIQLDSGAVVVLDGAHNPAGARALASALAVRPRPARRVWLFATMSDKDWMPTLNSILPHVDAVICTAGLSSPRFLNPQTLAREVATAAAAKNVSFELTPVAAVDRALAQLGSGDELVVAGSLYLVGDVRRILGLTPG